MALNDSIEQLAGISEKSESFRTYVSVNIRRLCRKNGEESIGLSEGKLQEEKLSERHAETFAWISAEVCKDDAQY